MTPVILSPNAVQHSGLLAGRPQLEWHEVLSELAGMQHGVIAGWQAVALGISDRWIARAVGRRYLHPIGEGLYAVGHCALSRRGRAVAAILRGGEGTVISHTSAARMWGLVSNATDGPIHVSLGSRRGLRSSESVVVHRPRELRSVDVTTRSGLPVTTPERTIRDELQACSVGQITRMLEQLVTQLGRTPDGVHAWGSQVAHVRGVEKLRVALDHIVAPVVLRSELESRFRTLCQHADLPLPETNTWIAGWETDVAWHDLGVAVELDSWRWHGGRWQFHRDRKKGLAINRAGYELIRITWPQVKYESLEVAETLRLVLARHARR
jgi:hypothetical protein